MKIKDERRFYNYIYLDPTKPLISKLKGLDIILKYEPFYVGKGQGNRLNDHKHGGSGRFMKNKMQSLKENNINPIVIKLISNLTDLESQDNEKYLIRIIGRRDLNLGPLTNGTDGGEGTVNKVITDKARTHIGTFKKGNIPWLKGKTMDSETKKKLSLSLKGRIGPRKGVIVSKETRLKMSNSQKGKTLSKETINKMIQSKIGFRQTTMHKPVTQYDLQGNFIKNWDSMSDVKFCQKSNISACCLGKRKTASGFIWKYTLIKNNNGN